MTKRKRKATGAAGALGGMKPSADPASDVQVPTRTAAFKLPTRTLARLKAYATAMGRREYEVAATALAEWLDGAIAASDKPKLIADLTKTYEQR